MVKYMIEKIYIPKEKIGAFVKAAVELSSPQGLGFLHFESGEIPQELVDEILSYFREEGHIALDMDYIQGRAVKMTLFRDEKGLYFTAPWYDHSDAELQNLCEALDIVADLDEMEHGVACNCDTCRAKRGEGSRIDQFTEMVGG